MNSRSLTEEQLAKLTVELLHQARYHNRLVERMQMLQFPLNDPLWIYGVNSRDALRDLLNIVRGVAVEVSRSTRTPSA